MRKRKVEQPSDGSGLICLKCRVKKPHDAYCRVPLESRPGKAYGGYGMPCKACRKEHAESPEGRAWRAQYRGKAETKAQMREHRAKWARENADAVAEYRASDQAKKLARKRNARYYQRHKPKLLEQFRTIYAESNKRATAKYRASEKGRDIHRLVAHRRRARLRSNGGDLTRTEWRAIVAAHDSRCIYCTRQPKRLSIDHVKPVIAGGRHDARNIVPACMRCNRKKHARPLLEALTVLEVDPLDFIFRRNLALLKLRTVHGFP